MKKKLFRVKHLLNCKTCFYKQTLKQILKLIIVAFRSATGAQHYLTALLERCGSSMDKVNIFMHY